ncbi:LytR/AlgR family response regulator transcription factor [Parasphingorhabdus sp. DH2-15]|uniref:LytR/AlgR family response regulator transcription factor n=1 Tax=Parasphingorhabdus sp. DH2-15 TaxID=3444112 RepID=UPI003F6876C6
MDPSTVSPMFKHVLITLAATILLSSCSSASTAPPIGISTLDWEHVTICPAADIGEVPPDFSEARCQTTGLANIDPQNRLIWIRAVVPLTRINGSNGEPLALFISGKMSSAVYFNGALIGENGRPSAKPENEVAGLMDAIFYPPQNLFHIGENEIVLLASSHQGYLQLASPIHMIGIAPADLLNKEILAQSAPVLITLGVFVLGSLYFGVMAVIGVSRFQFALLGIMSLSAGGQLISESLRGLVPYSYPIQDLRLIAITAFSAIFGMCVALHIFRTFKAANLHWVIAGITTLCASVIIFAGGFDFKALGAMTTPLLACLVATAYWAKQRRQHAFEYFLILLAFVAAIFVFETLFLDLIFFLLVAFFLLILFVYQARSLAAEARERRSEEARANRLEQALAQLGEHSEPDYIDVKEAGKLERIATVDIMHCSGADGYCELTLANGRTLLHNASLNEMEDALPATFLRIHRSHIVNIRFIQSLVRDASGTGTLQLQDSIALPVSRRIMPKVRQALT